MRVTSLKKLETYLYLNVILPLKQLSVEEMHFPSPITTESRDKVTLELSRSQITREYRRQYQRRRAQMDRDWLVNMTVGGSTLVVADYSTKYKWIKLYKRPFKDVDGMVIYSKLHELFSTNTPFVKVITMEDRGGRRINLRRNTVDYTAATEPYGFQVMWDTEEPF